MRNNFWFKMEFFFFLFVVNVEFLDNGIKIIGFSFDV